MGTDTVGRERFRARMELMKAARNVIDRADPVPFSAAYSMPAGEFKRLLTALQAVERIEARVQDIMKAY